MKKFVLFFICIFILLGCSSGSKKTEANALGEVLIASKQYVDVVDLAESVTPAVVGVACVSGTEQSVGSGVCVASGGYILSNSHVITNKNNITLYLYDGSTCGASYVWSDDSQDVAIIKANCTLPYLPMGANDDINVGQDVVAVGTPLSLLLKHSFTKGIVSALNRTLKVQGNAGESYMQNLIQHDASLNPGNSGGPLLNLNGEVVGINTLKISGGEGIGFAIPIKSISSLFNNIVTSKTSFETPYLGAYGYDSEIAEFNKLTTSKIGFYVENIASNSPLKNIGVKNGDVITSINGVGIKNTLDLRNELYKHTSGSKVKIGFLNNGKTYEREVILSKK